MASEVRASPQLMLLGVFTVYMMGWWQSAVWQRKANALLRTPGSNLSISGDQMHPFMKTMLLITKQKCFRNGVRSTATVSHWLDLKAFARQGKTRKIFSQGLIQKKHFNKLLEWIKSRWGLTSKRDKAECCRCGWWQKAKQQRETRNPRNRLASLFGKNTAATTQFTPDYSPTNWQRMGDRTGVKYFRSWGGDETGEEPLRGGLENSVSHAQPAQTRATRQTDQEVRETPRQQEYIDPTTTF